MLWRKVHTYSLGYFKWLTIVASLLLVIIAITGILYNHHHDFAFLEKGRISSQWLPDSYQQRLDRTRKAQGLEGLFPEEANQIPVMWLVKDLHTGDFWGPLGRLLYDLLALGLLIATISGCYLFLQRAARTRKKLQDKNQ